VAAASDELYTVASATVDTLALDSLASLPVEMLASLSADSLVSLPVETLASLSRDSLVSLPVETLASLLKFCLVESTLIDKAITVTQAIAATDLDIFLWPLLSSRRPLILFQKPIQNLCQKSH
jgi:hypothetical protein